MSEDTWGEAIDFDRYVPTVLSRLVGRLRSSANEFFDEHYSISLLDWRIISFIAAQGPSSIYAIWTEASLDKAAVTRAIRSLRERALVAVRDVPGQRRRKTEVTLTTAGLALHEASFGEIVNRHQRLLRGLSTKAIEQFLATVSHMERQVDAMTDGPIAPGPNFLPTKHVFQQAIAPDGPVKSSSKQAKSAELPGVPASVPGS